MTAANPWQCERLAIELPIIEAPMARGTSIRDPATAASQSAASVPGPHNPEKRARGSKPCSDNTRIMNRFLRPAHS